MSTDPFGQSLKRYRTSWGLTQEQFAQHFDTDVRTLRRWESGAVKPSLKNRQKLNLCLRVQEDAMKRRDFLRQALAQSLMFAAPCQQPDLHRFTQLLSDTTMSLSCQEELGLVETLTTACWQFLPHQANVVDCDHLAHVRRSHQMLDSWLASSPGSPLVDARLLSALSEITLVEAGLLYALKYIHEAEKAYEAALKQARQANNLLLEAVGLTWLSNFLIDTGRASRASAAVDAARRKADKGGATPLLRAWIAATEADALANQSEVYKCEVALHRATQLTHLAGSEPERYPLPYDSAWFFGYSGTVYAHLGRLSDARRAQRELEQGLALLDPASAFRQWGFSHDLIIAYSLDHNVDEACHSARLAMKRAQQSKAPVYLERAKNTTQRYLKPWQESPLVNNLMEEFREAEYQLALG